MMKDEASRAKMCKNLKKIIDFEGLRVKKGPEMQPASAGSDPPEENF